MCQKVGEFIEYFEGKTLPGIAAIKKDQRL
jgi:3-phosphoglycerate kinase